MTAELFRYFLQKKGDTQYLKLLIVAQCAPFLKRMRAAAIITIPSGRKEQMNVLLKETDIIWKELREESTKSMCILYREPDLRELLGRPENRHILYQNGYAEPDPENLPGTQLEELKERIRLYAVNGKFPHEIGVFLGYPPNDVEQFIIQNGENYKMKGYWKVYDDVADACRIFLAYDRAKKLAVNELLLGYDLKVICGREDCLEENAGREIGVFPCTGNMSKQPFVQGR